MITPEDNVLNFVDDYVQGVLSDEDAALVEQFCANNRLGQAALEDAERRYRAMQSLPPSEASEQLIQQTVGRIAVHENRRSKFRRIYGRSVLAIAVAASLVIGLLNVHYYRMQASPYDLRLLGQNELLAGSRASLRVAVFDHATQRPLAGVPVQLALYCPDSGETVELGSLTTDERGSASPRFDLPDWDDGWYELRVKAQPHGSSESLTESVRLRRHWRLMFSSDKPVYQPGQTIRLRALALQKPDLKPVAGHEVVFTVSDPKGNLIFKQRDVTSRFGIASADCALAREILEGEYHIECQVGETTSDLTVKVERYVLPKFKVVLNVDKSFYAPGEQVSGSIQADYFFGQPVANAQVAIDVRTTDGDAYPITAMDLRTDAQGHADFQFRLPDQLIGREQDSGNARFLLAATVTDAGGQKCSTGTSRIVSQEPIQIEVIPESGALVSGVSNTIFLFTSYADGRPAKTRLAINGQQDEIDTSELGVAIFEITPQEEAVGLTVKATDEDGRVGRRHVSLTCGAVDGDFLIRTDKAVYAGGDSMHLTALGGGVEPVFVDLIKDGQTIVTQQIEMAGGQGSYTWDIPADVFGTIELVAYRFRSHGLAVRKSRTIFVTQAKQLKIAATFDAGEYRPGEQAKVKLQLTDARGNPAPGAISLKAVDEAVYAVRGQQSGMEQTFFLLEQDLLEPVYTIYPGWSPQMFSGMPAVERNQFQQALLARTAAQVRGAQAVPAAFAGDGVAEPVPPQDFEIEEPYWEEGGAVRNPFTLAAASFPEKLQRVTALRRAGLLGVVVGWISLGGFLLLAGVIAFALLHPKAFLMIAVMGTTFSCCAGVPLGLLLALSSLRADFASGGLKLEDAAMAPKQQEAPAMDMAWGMDEPEEAFAENETLSYGDDGMDEAGSPPPRIRQWFPETLLWRPELITDDNGVVSLDVKLADSITSWRLSTSAVTAAGQLGGEDFPIKVFQPFFVDLNLPAALTRNDEVSVPVVVYNYLEKLQRVTLTLKDAEWFERLDGDGQQASETVLELKPGEIRSIYFPIRVLRVGQYPLEVTALASGVSDAIRREIEILPDGRREQQVTSGTLSQPCEIELAVPEDAIEGSVRGIVKLYPSSFSQLVEGLDAIFQMPGGCFEQTSSTTYPNVLALDYLRRTGKIAPEVEAKARQYIHAGYQRLISFEVEGGGFEWFGNPPANRTLTAYGLMEFQDMAKVHDVDLQLIERTRNWLMRQRRADGSWANEFGMLDDGLASTVNRGGSPDLAATAYIAWAIFADPSASSDAGVTLNFLLSHPPQSIQDPYLLAITANAIAAIDPQCGKLGAYLQRLDELKSSNESGDRVWWQQASGGRTTFYGSGQAGDIETTALAVLALLQSGQDLATARSALAWLIEQKDPHGTWYSTQATVLALKALLAGTGSPMGGDKERRVELALGGETIREFVIPADQSEVLQQFDFSEMLVPGNRYKVRLADLSKTAVGYQVSFRYHVDDAATGGQPQSESLSVDIAYDRDRLNVDETVTAMATIVNNMRETAPMVILDLPIPGGFAIEPGELDELVGSQLIAKYQITARQAIVYLRKLDPGQSLELRYRLRATMPVKVAVPDAEVYEYYDPSRKARGGAARLESHAT